MPDDDDLSAKGSAAPDQGGWADEVGRCREALVQIYAYLDGEITEEARIHVARHLADCTPCDHAFGFEAELKALVARCCCEQVPEGLRERIAAALGLTST